MKRFLAALALSLGLSVAQAAEKHPLDYSLREYGFLLAVALLGGLVSWAQRVRAGAVQAWNIMGLIGELATSAFAGLLVFWLCAYYDVPPPLTAALVGIAGHMGVRAIVMLEHLAERKLGVRIDVMTPIDQQPKDKP
jgi:CHASE2 domain-containing sensor protein